MTRVAILWHMHQPFYEDLVTREHVLPWVRLHALKDYFGMAALLREFPGVTVTFNLVPSLLVQIEAFAADRARDRYLELSLKPAEDLTPADATFMLENFFHAQRRRMVDAYPRYAELFARRGPENGGAADRAAAAGRFGRDDLRDLQVWQKLVWIDPIYQTDDLRIRSLLERGQHFSEQDKLVLREVELEILNRVLPEYRDAAARGQVELSASPFYHPILPLLCDTDVYLRTHPHSRMPQHRFVHPEDAAEQLERAATCHERLFGRRPVGLWPSEGSVSDAVVPIAVNAGFKWMATDEMILARSLDIGFTRDDQGRLDQPERLYRPYAVSAGGASIACLFRDHTLSDLIGFTYAGWNPESAAKDFVGRLAEAGRRYTERTGGGEAVIPIILDGENAWEHFEGNGRPFLRALYGLLSDHADVKTTTIGEACERQKEELRGIFPGSWIDANFYIWIGHADDQRAWDQLADARQALTDVEGADGAPIAQAHEEILIAEGSDWFWWYGDDHSSAHDLEFDDLFRRHVRNVYRLLKKPVPDGLFRTNITTGVLAPELTPPVSLIAPTIDGEETSYFEWLSAGSLDVREVAGAMHETVRKAALLTQVQFGFDRERLFMRVDAIRLPLDLLEAYELSIKFERPAGLRYSIRNVGGRLSGTFWERQPDGLGWVDRGPRDAIVAAVTIVEVSIPLANIGVGPGDPVSFFLALFRDSVEVERHPAQRPIDTRVPDAAFEAYNWTA